MKHFQNKIVLGLSLILCWTFVLPIHGDIYEIELLIKAKSLPGNTHFQWLAQQQHQLAEKAGEVNGVTYAIQSLNASIVAIYGYEYEIPVTLIADITEEGIDRFASIGIVPTVDLPNSEFGLEPKIHYKHYDHYICNGKEEYKKRTYLDRGIIQELKFLIYEDEGEKPGCRGSGVGLNYLNKINEILEYKNLCKNLDFITNSVMGYIEYDLTEALGTINKVVIQFDTDQKAGRTICGSSEEPSYYAEWFYDNPNDLIPIKMILFHTSFYQEFRVLSINSGDESALIIPDGIPYDNAE